MYKKLSSSLPYVDHYWYMTADEGGVYPYPASVQWGFLFVRSGNEISVTLMGPHAKSASIPYEKGQELWGVVFYGQSKLSNVTKAEILNQHINLPLVEEINFKLGDEVFVIPSYQELDGFIGELMDRSLLAMDEISETSIRTSQRKYKATTGLTPKQIEQASRVDAALELLYNDMSLVDVAVQAGFADQAHMTREFKILVGRTPAQIRSYYKL